MSLDTIQQDLWTLDTWRLTASINGQKKIISWLLWNELIKEEYIRFITELARIDWKLLLKFYWEWWTFMRIDCKKKIIDVKDKMYNEIWMFTMEFDRKRSLDLISMISARNFYIDLWDNFKYMLKWEVKVDKNSRNFSFLIKWFVIKRNWERIRFLRTETFINNWFSYSLSDLGRDEFIVTVSLEFTQNSNKWIISDLSRSWIWLFLNPHVYTDKTEGITNDSFISRLLKWELVNIYFNIWWQNIKTVIKKSTRLPKEIEYWDNKYYLQVWCEFTELSNEDRRFIWNFINELGLKMAHVFWWKSCSIRYCLTKSCRDCDVNKRDKQRKVFLNDDILETYGLCLDDVPKLNWKKTIKAWLSFAWWTSYKFFVKDLVENGFSFVLVPYDKNGESISWFEHLKEELMREVKWEKTMNIRDVAINVTTEIPIDTKFVPTHITPISILGGKYEVFVVWCKIVWDNSRIVNWMITSFLKM